MSETVIYDPLEPMRIAWLERNIDKLSRQAEEIEERLYGPHPSLDREHRAHLKAKLDGIYAAMGRSIEMHVTS